VVLVTAPDRLARNYVHQMVILEEFERREISVVFIDHRSAVRSLNMSDMPNSAYRSLCRAGDYAELGLFRESVELSAAVVRAVQSA
jgi:hypothetical protein